MQYLSLKESKEVAAKFLNYFNRFDKEKLEKYFTPEPSKPKSIWKRMYKFLFVPNPPKIDIYSDLRFEKYYKAHLHGYAMEESRFEDEEGRFDKFYEALKKTLKENNISLLYAIRTDPTFECSLHLVKNKLEAKRIISLSLNNPNDSVLVGTSTFVFSKNFSFLLKCDFHGAISIYGSKKLINDFKKNYPEYHEDFLS